MMRADGDELNHIFSFVMKDCTIVSSHIYTLTARIGVMKQMIVKDWVKWIFEKQISPLLKLLL